MRCMFFQGSIHRLWQWELHRLHRISAPLYSMGCRGIAAPPSCPSFLIQVSPGCFSHILSILSLLLCTFLTPFKICFYRGVISMTNRLSCVSCDASVLEPFGTASAQCRDRSWFLLTNATLTAPWAAPGHGHPIQLLCKCAVSPTCPKCTRFQHSSSSTLQSICDCTCPTCSESVSRSGVVWPWLIAFQRTAPALSSHACSCITLLL